ERQVDPRADRLARLGNPVPPVMLTRPAHDQQAAVRQVELERLAGRGVLEDKPALGPERDGSDDWVRAQFRLVVGVEADGVATVAVEVEEQAVPGCAGR